MSGNHYSPQMEAVILDARKKIEDARAKYDSSEVSYDKLDDVLNLEDFKAYPDRETARTSLASIFKSYDIRGVVLPYTDQEGINIHVNLSEDIARRIGWALGSLTFQELPGTVKALNPGDVFVIGGDNGTTSPSLLEGLAYGLTRTGVNVVLCGEGCTGVIYEAIQRLGAQGGAMITRSHVEKEYNGMKIVLGREALHSRFIEQIRQAVFSGEVRRVNRPAAVITDLKQPCKVSYEMALVREFKDALSRGNSPVAINFGGGTARNYRKCLEDLMGKRLVKVFREESDPEALEGLPDPTQPRYLQKQIAWSRENPEVTLFSFDLDADRVSVMIEGELYLGDVMAFPLAAYKLEKEGPDLKAAMQNMGTSMDTECVDRIAGTFLCDPRCTKQLTQLVEALEGTVVQHRIGHSHIKATMNRLMEELSECAGFGSVAEFVEKTGYTMWQAEYSLHFFGTDEMGVPADDAIRFMLKFIAILDYFGRKLNQPNLNLKGYLHHLNSLEILDSFVQAPEIRTVYDNEDKSRVVSDMETAMEKEARQRGWTMTGMKDLGDGFRLDTPQGFILFRYSNTSPKLTMRIEAIKPEVWMDYFNLIFTHYNRLRIPEYTLDMNENSFLREKFGITDANRIGM